MLEKLKEVWETKPKLILMPIPFILMVMIGFSVFPTVMIVIAGITGGFISFMFFVFWLIEIFD